MVVATVQNTLEDTPDYLVINMTAANIINDNQIAIQYQCKSKPVSISHLNLYEYSLDDVIWYTMTVTEDSEINNLHVSRNWLSFNLTWDALNDIIDKIIDTEEGLYNRAMWIRFMASNDSQETYLVIYQMYFKNPIYKLNLDSSNNHIDINGCNLLEQAPGVF